MWTCAFAVRAESMHTLGAVTEFAAAFLAFLARFLARLAAARSSISAPAAPVWTFAWTITTTSVGLAGGATSAGEMLIAPSATRRAVSATAAPPSGLACTVTSAELLSREAGARSGKLSSRRWQTSLMHHT